MTESHAPQQSPRMALLAGALGALMITAAVVVGVAQAVRPQPVAEMPTGPVPALAILSPAPGDTIEGMLHMRFTAGDRLALGPRGWESDGLHLHAYLDGREIMPAAADIMASGNGEFMWMMNATPGAHTLQLRWAGTTHGDLTEGASDEVRFTVR